MEARHSKSGTRTRVPKALASGKEKPMLQRLVWLPRLERRQRDRVLAFPLGERRSARAKPRYGDPFYTHPRPQVAAHFTLVRTIN